MWSIINSPLLVATDVRNMTDIMKKVLLNTEIIAVNQNNEYAAGNIVSSQTTNCDSQVKDACQVWAKQLSSTSSAIVLFNAGNGANDVTVDFSSIPNMGWTSSTTLNLRDLWDAKDLGKVTGKYTASKLAPHAVQFLTGTISSS